MKNNWIPVRDIRHRPVENKPIWLGSLKRQKVIMGYYIESIESFFDMDGNGVGCSHWMPIEKPEPPQPIQPPQM